MYDVTQVNVTEQMTKKAESIVNKIENVLQQRFSEASEAFGFSVAENINIWDFLSVKVKTATQLKSIQSGFRENLIQNVKIKGLPRENKQKTKIKKMSVDEIF